MKFGLMYANVGPFAFPEMVTHLAQTAERCGVESLWTVEHVVVPVGYKSTYPYDPSGKMPAPEQMPLPDPLAWLAYVAAVTKTIKLATGILILPQRHPLYIAKEVATLDVLSHGRVILGIGVGWLEEEFQALASPPYAERGRVTDEYLRLMRECWTREPVRWKGRYYQMAEMSIMPKPRQAGGIPIWAGGHTDAALRRTGELADGWHPIGHRPPAVLHPPEYADKVAIIHGCAAKAGQKASDITLSFRAPLDLVAARAKRAPGDRQPFRGTAPEVIADVKSYQLYASDHADDTNVTTGDCPTQDGAKSVTGLKAGPVGDPIAPTSSEIQQAEFATSVIVTKAGLGACDASNTSIAMCMQAKDGLNGAGNSIGTARVKLILSTTKPNPPTDVRADGGEQALTVRWTAPGTSGGAAEAITYTVRVKSSDPLDLGDHGTGTTRITGGGTADKSHRVTGLMNGVTYAVTVRSFSIAGNPSATDGTGSGTPVPVTDFFEGYKNAGGVEQGGCGAGAAGPLGLLFAAAALAVLRRRK
jgi:probable F420-dependent oxidoreductase